MAVKGTKKHWDVDLASNTVVVYCEKALTVDEKLDIAKFTQLGFSYVVKEPSEAQKKRSDSQKGKDKKYYLDALKDKPEALAEFKRILTDKSKTKEGKKAGGFMVAKKYAESILNPKEDEK